MTKRKGYIPTTDGGLNIWQQNLHDRIMANLAALGLAAPDGAAIQGFCTDIKTQIDTAEAAKLAAKQAFSNKQNKIALDLTNLRNYVRRMKAAPGYTEAIGMALGIVGEDSTVDEANAQPELGLRKDPTGWRIDFNLHGHFDGVNIYKKLSTAADFTFLARDTSNPYIDTAAVDNGTRYHAYYVLADEEVGLVSNDVVITL